MTPQEAQALKELLDRIRDLTRAEALWVMALIDRLTEHPDATIRDRQ